SALSRLLESWEAGMFGFAHRNPIATQDSFDRPAGFSDLRVAHRVLSAPGGDMKTVVLTLIALTMPLLQQSEPVVSKDSISIHTVRKGNMRLQLILAGAISSMEPARAVVSGPLIAAGRLRIGQVNLATVEFVLHQENSANVLVMEGGVRCLNLP